ncbi:MAG: cation:proton antiporter, partial [bacterium]
ITEVPLTMLLGYSAGQWPGWSSMDSLFLGGILAIASTAIIIRAFDELGLRNRKFAGIVTGVLVIEDLVAVLLLVLLSTVAVSKKFAGPEMINAVLKLSFFLVLWFMAGIFFIPTLFRRLRTLLNDETLLVISLALCFLMVVLSTLAGFSSALGAFVMGSILAETTRAERIEHLTKPVKTLFGAIFFISVGMLINPQVLLQHIIPVGIATVVLLLGKPIFVILGSLAARQPVTIAVRSGMSLSQIGEFSFIIAALGLVLGVTSSFLYPVAVAVSVLTTFTTPYMIRLSGPVAGLLEKILPAGWRERPEQDHATDRPVSEKGDWIKVLILYVVNVIVFSVIIITILLFGVKYLELLSSAYKWHSVTTTVVILILLSPFLWGLAFRRPYHKAYMRVWARGKRQQSLFVMQVIRMILALLFIAALFTFMFSPLIAVTGIAVTCAILILSFKKIRTFYWKIETRFFANYHERESGAIDPDLPLTPWDLRIAGFELGDHSPFAGKRLSEAGIREAFGVNIIRIDRGGIIISVPDKHTYLFPGDKISVIGDSEQILSFKKFLETPPVEPPFKGVAKPVSLHHFTVKKHARLVGQTIRGSGIREKSRGLIVGIEREERHLANPDAGVAFEVHDKVWIVGDEHQIRVALKELQSANEN